MSRIGEQRDSCDRLLCTLMCSYTLVLRADIQTVEMKGQNLRKISLMLTTSHNKSVDPRIQDDTASIASW